MESGVTHSICGLAPHSCHYCQNITFDFREEPDAAHPYSRYLNGTSERNLRAALDKRRLLGLPSRSVAPGRVSCYFIGQYEKEHRCFIFHPDVADSLRDAVSSGCDLMLEIFKNYDDKHKQIVEDDVFVLAAVTGGTWVNILLVPVPGDHGNYAGSKRIALGSFTMKIPKRMFISP